MTIPIEISARHIHLSKVDKDILFGSNYQLQKQKDLSQPNQFAAQETVDIKSAKSSINQVRIIGPERTQTQLELSLTDAYNLHVAIKVKASGDLADSTGGIEVIGPKGKIKLQNGVIAAQRHLHIEPELASKHNLADGQLISLKVPGVRSIIFNNVIVRSHQDIDKLAFQIDTDEANASGVNNQSTAEII